MGDAGAEAGSSMVLEDFDFAREIEMRGGVMLLACKHHGQALASEDAAHAAGGPEICSKVLYMVTLYRKYTRALTCEIGA